MSVCFFGNLSEPDPMYAGLPQKNHSPFIFPHFMIPFVTFCCPPSLDSPPPNSYFYNVKNFRRASMKYERETSNLLRRLGVNNSYVGFRYTIYGVIRAIANPELLTYISKGLYVEIAARYQTSVGCVERNIRTIINTIWLHGDRNLLNQVFGFELAQKPRNGAFIDALAHYVVLHYYD